MFHLGEHLNDYFVEYLDQVCIDLKQHGQNSVKSYFDVSAEGSAASQTELDEVGIRRESLPGGRGRHQYFLRRPRACLVETGVYQGYCEELEHAQVGTHVEHVDEIT